MTDRGAGQLELFASSGAANHPDTLCICAHYGIEHDDRGRCLALDLFGDECDCPGYEPDTDEDE